MGAAGARGGDPGGVLGRDGARLPAGDLWTAPGSRLGTFDGTWDGAAWRGTAWAVLDGDSLTVVGHRPDPQYFYDEYVQARVRFAGPGTYPVPPSDGALAKIVGGDAGSFPPSDGTLVIYSYDAASHTISGALTLRAGSMSPAWNASGLFDAPVYSSFQAVPQEAGRYPGSGPGRVARPSPDPSRVPSPAPFDPPSPPFPRIHVIDLLEIED